MGGQPVSIPLGPINFSIEEKLSSTFNISNYQHQARNNRVERSFVAAYHGMIVKPHLTNFL